MGTRTDDPPGGGADPRTPLIFGESPGPDPTRSLATREVDEMVAAWRRGERPTAEDYLARRPGLGDEAAIRLIYEEYCLRQEAGLEADPAEFARRFPKWRDELEVLLDCHRLLGPSPRPTDFPSVGEAVAGFRLIAELGRGASGRVFLATQHELADRPVALKVTHRGREEHLSLAQLQHMNIMPLYSAQVLRDRDLQVLCMPSLGGASLAQVMDRLRDVPPARRTGRHLLDALDEAQASRPVALPTRGPFRQYLARAPYAEAICWIGACLADGLQYAHERDVLHMDIKPSNALLAGDGQPMLLDFHVSCGPIAPGAPAPAWMGGTPEYMPPEQRRALEAVLEGRNVPDAVDGRADIYSLGLMLYEALGGPGPRERGAVPPPLHRANPRVSLGLSDIIQKCLRPDPNHRYLDAASLAADLRRHLDHRPLRGVPNRSLAERWRKWRRRRPAGLSRGLALLVLALSTAAALGVLWVTYRQRVSQIEDLLIDGRSALDGHRYSEAATTLRRGLALAEHVPAVGRQRRALADALAIAVRDDRAEELHRIADLLRFRYGIDPPPPEEARSLVRRGREIWRAREALLRPTIGRREPEVERKIREDLLDVLLVWADLLVRSAPPDEADGARREAARVLDEAADVLGPSPALDRDRLAYARLGRSDPPPTPRTAREHDALGRSYLRSGEFARAADQFRLGLELRPQEFWLNFHQGLCAYRLGRFDDAADAFRVCVALSPGSAECSYNRALAFGALGRVDEAIHEYGRALRLDPDLAEAALNRGLLHYRAGQLTEAGADLRRALASASDPAVRRTILDNLSLVESAREDRTEAVPTDRPAR